MNLKTFPILFSTLALSLIPLNQSEQQSDEYKVSDYITIRNLLFYNGNEFGYTDAAYVISFDIKLDYFNVRRKIYLKSDATDQKKVLIPEFEPDPDLRYQYQNVHLKMSSLFSSYIGNNEKIRIYYGDEEMFSIICPSKFNIHTYHEFKAIDELPSDRIFKNIVHLPRIRNGILEDSFTETIDLSRLNFDRIINSWYGRYPDEHMWVKYSTDLFTKEEIDLLELNKKYPVYIHSIVYFYGGDLFKDYYRREDDSWKMYPYGAHFQASDSFENYYHLDYWNLIEKVTYKDGIMRVLQEIDDELLENGTVKKSQYVTFPLSEEDFEKNYEKAKNMKIKIMIDTGYMDAFHFSIDLDLNLKKDYFYNHLSEYSLMSNFDNDDLDTVDIFYA